VRSKRVLAEKTACAEGPETERRVTFQDQKGQHMVGIYRAQEKVA
jgi:hypothetical protein